MFPESVGNPTCILIPQVPNSLPCFLKFPSFQKLFRNISRSPVITSLNPLVGSQSSFPVVSRQLWHSPWLPALPPTSAILEPPPPAPGFLLHCGLLPSQAPLRCPHSSHTSQRQRPNAQPWDLTLTHSGLSSSSAV